MEIEAIDNVVSEQIPIAGDTRNDGVDYSEQDQVGAGTDEGADTSNSNGEQPDDGGGDEITVSIDGEDAHPDETEHHAAPAWVKSLRKRVMAQEREIKELRAKAPQPAPTEIKLEEKPTLEACDYDTQLFEKKLESWHINKREYEKQEAARVERENNAAAAWNAKLTAYEESKKSLKVADFDGAEYEAREKLSQIQQGAILSAAENPALMIYALGKNPKKLEELSKIEDPVKFIWEASKLESKLRTQPKRAPEPTRSVAGSGGISGGDKHLEQLRKEADRTGDRSKVAAYLRSKRG